MKKLFATICLMASIISLGACNKKKGPSTDTGTQTTESIDPTVQVTVNFYLDYNDSLVNGKRYHRCVVQAGSLITDKPATPTSAPQEEFPVFIGWSKKEIINDLEDLWDFDKDVVPSSSKILNIYGIWAAEGEH